jgi:hypothetical protein
MKLTVGAKRPENHGVHRQRIDSRPSRPLRSLRSLRFKAVLVFAFGARPSHAQAPNLDWRTLETQHFYVHFNPPLEPLARRIAGDAERAYGELSRELHPPRGMIDVVLSDDVDFSNGSATPYPTNRIIIYANPPVSESALRYTNDWGQLVITHELTHIFHLDRSRGIWALSQHIFGRAAALFPNSYSPSWLTEGLAVYEESKLAGAGRIEGSEHRMIARAAAIDHTFPSIGALSLAQGRFPFGESAYSFGSLFVDYLAKTQGDSRVRAFVEKSSADIIPYLVDIPARQGFGISFSQAWRAFRDSVARSIRVPTSPPHEGWRQLTTDGVFVFAPRWTSDSSIVYSGAPGRESFGAFRVDLAGKRSRVGRRNSRSANVPIAGGALLYAQMDFVNPYQQRSDLWIQRGGKERQITFGQRLTSPDVRSDGDIVAAQIIPGATRLVRVSPDGKRITPLTTGSYDEQWTEPRWSHAGDRIAASRWVRGNISQIVILDTLGRIVHIVSSGTSIEATPSWLPDDAGVLYSADRDGSAQFYAERFDDPLTFAGATTYRLSSAATGLFEPTSAPRSASAAAVLFRADGYHLGVGACCATTAGERVADYRDTIPRVTTMPVIDSGPSRKYSPWRTLLPRYWLPQVDLGIDNGYRVGALTSGSDVIGRHSYTADFEIPTNDRGGVVANASYQYSGFGLPIIQANASQDWQSLGGISDRTPQQNVIGEAFRRTWNGELLATLLRQRYRTSVSLTGGVGVEHRTHVTTPTNLISSIDTTGAFGSPTFPSLIAAASFANYQRPAFSISPEDGVVLSATVRDRMRSGLAGQGAQTLSTVAAASLYKSFDLPGFAHHVLALRGAAGYADERSNGYFTVGGVSGNPFQIIPGYVLGEGRKTFPVRGFSSGTLLGIRALAGSAEYRIPLLLTGGAPGPLPFFFDRSSLTLFADYGSAWCPSLRADREVCNTSTRLLRQHLSMASAGAELNLNLGVLSWDSPYRFRLGVAKPTYNGSYLGQPSIKAYVVSGVSF